MFKNTCLLYNSVNEAYHKGKMFCNEKGFVVKDSNEEFFFIRAHKKSFLFWKNLNLELEILAVEKDKVQLKMMVYKFGIRRPKLENQYIADIENRF